MTHVPQPILTEGSEEVLGIFDNPMHRHEVEETVANVMNVPVENVKAATMTSAFVGFDDAKSASEAYTRSESRRVLQKKIAYSLYKAAEKESESVKDFVSKAASPDCILQLDNLSGGMSLQPSKLLNLLNTKTSASNLTTENILFPSPTTALIQLPSPEQTNKLLHSNSFTNLMKHLSRQILRVQPAQRQVLFDKYGGAGRQFEMRKMTHKLIVAGDTPSHNFFISHGAVLHLSNVDPSITKLDLSQAFQKYCNLERDVNGSIEFVTSMDGHKTGRVYVGFDLESEGQNAWDAISQSGHQIQVGKQKQSVKVRPVKERALLRGAQKTGERSERSQDELWASLQHSWKDHVEEADLEFLESHGVTRDVLEDAFLAARYNNPSFGVEDLERSGDKLHADRIPGQEYGEFVQLYVETLKELVTTRENPGALYESMFLPGEEMEFSLFDEEEERLEKLREERSKLV